MKNSEAILKLDFKCQANFEKTKWNLLGYSNQTWGISRSIFNEAEK